MAESDRGYHPSPSELERFLLGESAPKQATAVITHLLRGCAHCRNVMGSTVGVMFGTGPVPSQPSMETAGEYDFPLFKAFASARRLAAQTAAASFEDRGTSPLKAVPTPASADEERRDWLRCERLIETCRYLRYNDPETLVLTARLSVALANRLEPGLRSAEDLADLQACAIAELANACRVTDDFVAAEAGLALALRRAGQGTGSPLLLAHIMDLTSSLFVDQSRFADAQLLIDAVYAIQLRKGDSHSIGRALISRGFAAVNALQYEAGLGLLAQGLGMVEPARDLRLTMSGIFNLLWSLVECGLAEQANTLLSLSRQLLSTLSEQQIDGGRFVWLEGRIAAALQDDASAELRFLEARSRFEDLKLPAYAALVSLDLAALWLRAKRTGEILSMIEETISVFRDHSMSREAIATLLIVRGALEKQQVTEAFLRATAAELLKNENLSRQRSRILG